MSTLKTNNLTDALDGSAVSLNGHQLYSRENIVGTVSQENGVPTGAIIESGENANGRYVKYADGTLQIHDSEPTNGSRALSFTNSGSVTQVTRDFPVEVLTPRSATVQVGTGTSSATFAEAMGSVHIAHSSVSSMDYVIQYADLVNAINDPGYSVYCIARWF